MIFQTGRYR